MKALVVCYSNSGTTAVLAEHIAGQLGAELESIDESNQRPPLLRDGQQAAASGGAMARAAMAAFFGLGSAIKENRADPAQYDLVVIGTPVWAGSMTPAVRSYLKRHRKSLPRVAFFCTAGDPSKLRALNQMSKQAGKDPVATLVVKSDDARTDACAGMVERFVAQLTSVG